MSIGGVVCLGLAVFFLAAPVALVLWARSAKMFSGKMPDYDGPSRKEAHLPQVAEVRGGGLSSNESLAWDGLTRVAWNMASKK